MSKYRNKKVAQYRSKLEEYCADQLKEHKVDFCYEPFQLTIVEGFEYEPESWEKVGKISGYKLQRKKVNPIRYTPDFVSHPNVGDVVWIIETKGYFNPLARIKWKLFKQWLLKEQLDWRLFLPTNKREVKESIDLIVDYEQSKRVLRRKKGK